MSRYQTRNMTAPTYRSNMKGESSSERQTSFNNIFRKHIWIGSDAILEKYADIQSSGPGSLPANTGDVQETLTKVIESIKVKLNVDKIKLLDIPCGDLVWMSQYLKSRRDIEYIGVDIVGPIIDHHKKEYNETGWSFIQHDIAARPLNISADLVFSRQMLQHLSNYDTLKALQHMSQSGSKYLLTTTVPTIGKNVELSSFLSYRFRPQNLELLPFSLAPPLCMRKDAKSFVGLWRLPLKQVS